MRLSPIVLVLVLGCAPAEPPSCPEPLPAPAPAATARRTPTAPDPADPLAGLAWLAGGWFAEEGATRSEEHWTLPRAAAMLGMSRNIDSGRMVHHEQLMIERTEQGVVYRSWPSSQAPATFPLATLESNRVVFIDQGHDFPQRIDYRLETDGSLFVRLDGVEGGKPRHEEWRWRRLEE